MIHETDPTADRLREILDHPAAEHRAGMLASLADDLDRQARARADRAAQAHPAEALLRIADRLAADLETIEPEIDEALPDTLRRIAAHVSEIDAHGRTKARAVQTEAARQTDELALRALETVLDVEPFGRDVAPLIETPPEEDDTIVARDRVRVSAAAQAVYAVDELGRHAHMIRKGLALGPLRDDPDARIRTLESVLRRVLVMVDTAHARILDRPEPDHGLDELGEILWRTINLAASAAPGPVTLHGPSTRYREIPSVVELDEAARQVDRIAHLRFPVPERTGPDPSEAELTLRADVQAARMAAADAAVALARLGANRPHGIRPADWPSPWDRLDDLAALLDRNADLVNERIDSGVGVTNAQAIATVIERARYLVEQAGGDAARWTPPGNAGNGSNDPE